MTNDASHTVPAGGKPLSTGIKHGKCTLHPKSLLNDDCLSHLLCFSSVGCQQPLWLMVGNTLLYLCQNVFLM